MLGKKKENVKIWIVGEEQGQERTLIIWENAKMKKLPLLTVHFANILQVESTVEKKSSGFIVHQAVAEKQLTLLSDKADNVDSLKAFFIDADLEIEPASVAAGGGGKALTKSRSKMFSFRKHKTPAAPKVQLKLALRDMVGDDGYEGCIKGDLIKVIEELDDGSGCFWIMTEKGKGLLHPDAFLTAIEHADDSEDC